MNCPSGKRIYHTENEAENALIKAQINFVHNNAIAIYQCNDCKQWHLTSKGIMNTRLEEELKNGKIEKERKAMLWGKSLI